MCNHPQRVNGPCRVARILKYGQLTQRIGHHTGGTCMHLSARNKYSGTVSSIEKGEVTTLVTVHLDGGQEMTALITKDAVGELSLTEGKHVTAAVKASEVMLAVE